MFKNNLKNTKLLNKTELLKKYSWCKILVWEYIETSYREPKSSILYCFSTLFTIHNELINIWSHLIGSLWILYLLFTTLTTLTNYYDLAIFSIYLTSAFIVCVSSTSFHLFCCHSESVCKKTQCLDWIVISCLIFSSNLIVSYYELSFNKFIFVFVTFCNFILMFLTSSITLTSLQNNNNNNNTNNKIKDNEYKIKDNEYKIKDNEYKKLLNNYISSYSFRAGIYIIYGLGIIIVLLLKFILTGIISSSLQNILIMYGFYSSVILCIFHFPECISPGSFDIIGYSHQIFHYSVIAGITVLWKTYYKKCLLNN